MRKIRRTDWILAGLCCVLCSILLSACGRAPQETSHDTSDFPVVKIGTDVYPPYNYTGVDGKPCGIDVEIATEAFHRMGYEPQFISISWEEKKELLENGDIDCIWTSFSMDGREDTYMWAGPYMMSRQVVAVSKESDIYNLQDLEDKIVAVQATTKPEELFLDHSDDRIPALRGLFSMQNREAIYPALSKGYVDAVAAHETSIRQYMADYNVEYRILEEPLMNVGLGVAFDKDGDSTLRDQLQKTFQDMLEDGTIRTILADYLEDPDKFLEVGEYGR